MATLETKCAEARVSSTFTHGSEDSGLDGAVGASECDGRQALRGYSIKSVSSPNSEVVLDAAASVKVAVNDEGVELLAAN